MATIPPIDKTQGSSEAPREKTIEIVQDILDHHCTDYPQGAGCNLVVMQEGKEPILLSGGTIVPNGAQNWGSDTKQFTAACIDKLVKQGLIAYDDDIHIPCPDLPSFEFNGVPQKVTIDDLLHMRSGLPEVWAISLMAGHDAEYLTNEQLLDLLKKHPGMVFPPGSNEMYCNTNYYLLAKIVEDVSKRPFIDYVRDEILVPLEMQARCSLDPSCPKTIPGFDGSTYKDVTSPNRSYGTTGLIGPPADMIKWNASVARRDYDLLAPPKQTIDHAKKVYCRGLNAQDTDDYHLISHGGCLAGAVAIYRRYEHKDPSKTFAFFLATNVDNIPKAEEIANDITDALAGKKMERDLQEPELLASNKEKDAAIFNGTYECLEFGTKWIVEAKELQKGKWVVCISPVDGRDFPPIDFEPNRDREGHLSFRSIHDGGPLIQTSDGFIYDAKKMAPVHFKRL